MYFDTLLICKHTCTMKRVSGLVPIPKLFPKTGVNLKPKSTGKMPVYKQLAKTIKTEEVKKDGERKKEEGSAEKKAEMDAEIQRKVADFKEKIAKAQQEREQQLEHLKVALPPPALLQLPVPAPAPRPNPPQGAPALPKDFQEALDIIFPTDPKVTEKLHQDLFSAMQPGILGCPPFMQPFNPAHLGPLGLMQPPGMLGFDLNAGLFPQPQLYDQHVPLSMPTKQTQLNFNKKNARPHNKQYNKNNVRNNGNSQAAQNASANGEAAAKKKEELDDLAMLGIDASDVGSGM